MNKDEFGFYKSLVKDLCRQLSVAGELVAEYHEKLDDLVYLALSHGIITRGKACEYLNLEREELDEWMLRQEGKG